MELVIQEEQAYMILTRLQKERAERTAAATLAKEITSGVKSRKIDTSLSEDDHLESLQKMDDSKGPLRKGSLRKKEEISSGSGQPRKAK